MAKVILFSDLHAHPFRPYATILPNGMNSRLADAVSCIRQVYDHATAIGADLVIFGGDMFHTRKTVSVPAFNACYEEMAKFAVEKIPVVMIHGNHDQADKEGTQYSIYAFNVICHVVDKPGWIVLQGAEKQTEYAIHAVPYLEDVEHLREIVAQPAPQGSAHKIFLGHLGIQGAVVGADFVYTNPHDPQIGDLCPQNYRAVFLGHYHKHQSLAPNAWYIGAPLQHNWGDRGDSRGFLIYDTETETIEHVPLKAPEFIEISDGTVTGRMSCRETLDDCFVRIVSARNWSEMEREAHRKKLNARTLEVVPPKLQALSPQSRMVVDPSMSSAELIERYVHSGLVSTEGLDQDYLMQIAQEILQEVEESA